MATKPNFPCWGFVIDTDKYAGNFEREMCAYLTGRTGECGVGKPDEDKDYSIFGYDVIDVADDNGCERPVTIYPTPGFYNNGMGFEYKTGQEEVAIEAYKKSMVDYYQPLIKIAEDHKKNALAGKQVHNWTIEACDRSIKDYQSIIDSALSTTKETLGKYPSYQSVCIFFSSKPTNEQISFMKTKAIEFTKNSRSKWSKWTGRIDILGYRVVEFKTSETSQQV